MCLAFNGDLHQVVVVMLQQEESDQTGSGKATRKRKQLRKKQEGEDSPTADDTTMTSDIEEGEIQVRHTISFACIVRYWKP